MERTGVEPVTGRMESPRWHLRAPLVSGSDGRVIVGNTSLAVLSFL